MLSETRETISPDEFDDIEKVTVYPALRGTASQGAEMNGNFNWSNLRCHIISNVLTSF